MSAFIIGLTNFIGANYSEKYVNKNDIKVTNDLVQLYKDAYTTMNGALSVKNALMSGVAKKVFKKNSRFEKPSSVVEVEVEKETMPLQLPSEYTPSNMRMTELFKKGTEPTETSFRYQKLEEKS